MEGRKGKKIGIPKLIEIGKPSHDHPLTIKAETKKKKIALCPVYKS